MPVAFGQKVLGTNRSDVVLWVGKALICQAFGRLGFLPVPNLLVHFPLPGCPTPIVGRKRCNELGRGCALMNGKGKAPETRKGPPGRGSRRFAGVKDEKCGPAGLTVPQSRRGEAGVPQESNRMHQRTEANRHA